MEGAFPKEALFPITLFFIKDFMMLVDHIGNWRRYGLGPAWEETMRWLENYAPGGSGSLADLTDGTHP